MMMSLGQFVFSLPTIAYQQFQRQTEWKHPSTSRVGERDAYQYTGKGEDLITLSGWFAPSLSGKPASIDDLHAMADRGESYVLVEGTGKIYGQYAITNIDDSRSMFFQDGLARKIDFTIKLKRVDRGDQIAQQTDNSYEIEFLDYLDDDIAE